MKQLKRANQKLPAFMEPEPLLPCSQEPKTGPYSESIESDERMKN
jgi:hypothetical protein